MQHKMEIITSASNKIAKHVRALAAKKTRDASGTFVVEGEKFVAEIAGGWETELVVVSESFAKANCLKKYHTAPLHVVGDRVFASISDVKQPQGVLAVVRQRVFDINDMLTAPNPLLILLEDMQDPGNLGSILRIAHGLGACGVILSENCADVYGPKVVRSSAGSVFHVPFVTAHLPAAIATLKGHGVRIFAAKGGTAHQLHQLDFCAPTAFIIGNEAKGLSAEIAALADAEVSIPVKSESLNAAVACGILVYEAWRQRV